MQPFFTAPQRQLEGSLENNDTLITSYGVLLQDIDRLSRIDWTLIVFDEIQYVKKHSNPDL